MARLPTGAPFRSRRARRCGNPEGLEIIVEDVAERRALENQLRQRRSLKPSVSWPAASRMISTT